MSLNLKIVYFSKTNYLCCGLLLLMIILASVEPLHFSSYALHQVGTLISIAFLLYLTVKIRLTDRAFISATIFLLIHIIGARYLYSYVPYSEWTEQIFGFSLNNVMGWQRNMYDRLVHFCYGLCLFAMFCQIIEHYFKQISKKQLVLLAFMLNMATSLMYEWLEWLIAVMLSPEQAEAYNGQQGDMWDAHKDMLLALMGSVLASFGNIVKNPNVYLHRL